MYQNNQNNQNNHYNNQDKAADSAPLFFNEDNMANESFSQNYADAYEKQMNFNFRDNNLNETVLEQKLKKIKNSIKIPVKNSNSSFCLFNEMDNFNDFEDNLNITIQDKTNDDYLYVRKLPKFSEEEFLNIKKSVSDNLLEIYNYLFGLIKQNDYAKYDLNKKVGPLMPLTFVIENNYEFKPQFKNEMQKKYDRLKKYICNYRTIYGDGNCYYRAVIFKYIELLILNKKSDILKQLIIDIYRSFQSNEIQTRLDSNNKYLFLKVTIQVLITIMELIQNNRIYDAHVIFYKALLYSKIFDFSLIIYLRYIIYMYIKQNEQKLYLESFPVLIGNLLPSNYEKNGVFDFNSFYQNFLLKMYQYAEKIVIYLTPFVLGVDLNVILFDDNEDEVIKKFSFYGKSDLNISDSIFILNRRGHYENIFSLEENQKYNYIYNIYRGNYQPKFITPDCSLNINNLNTNQNNPLNNNQNNPLNNNQRLPGNNYNNNAYNVQNYQNNQNQTMYNNQINNTYNRNIPNYDNNQKLNSKTVINKTSTGIREQYFPNQNYNNTNSNYNNYYNNYYNTNFNNYNYQNNYNTNYNNNNYQNNYNTNYNNNYYNQNLHSNQNNSYHRLNSQTQIIQNNNNINNYKNQLNQNKTKDIEVGYNSDSQTGIYNYQNKNTTNLIEFDPSSNLYNMSERINKNTDMNNNNNQMNNNINNNINNNVNNNMNNNVNNNINNNINNNVNNNMNNNINNNTNNNINCYNMNNYNTNNNMNHYNNANNNINPYNTNNNINNNINPFTNNNNMNNNINYNTYDNTNNNNYRMNNNNNINYNKNNSNDGGLTTIEFNKENQSYGQFKCNNCNLSHSGLNTIKNMCPKCFSEEIIKQSKYFYIEYLKNVTKLEKVNKITINDFENLFLKKILINIDNKQYTIYQAINEFNTQQNNQFNFNKIMGETILRLKQQICLYCYNNVQSTDLQMPCGCNFCCKSDLHSFFNEKINNRITYNFKCFCSYEYKPNNVLELCNYLLTKNYFEFNQTISILNYLFYKICFKCGKEKNNLQPVAIEGFCPFSFNHFICEDCFKNDSPNNECIICKIKHNYNLKDY